MTQKARGITEETLEEIIKALAYGLDTATVADCNGVSLAEAEAIAAEQEAVAARRAELREVYPDEF